MENIETENFSIAINRIGAVAVILFLLNAPLTIYLREAPQAAVVGVPDPISLFGIPITLREISIAMLVSIFIQWSLVRNLFFVLHCLQKKGSNIKELFAISTQRAGSLNPFFRLDGKIGVVFALLTLAGFCMAISVANAQLAIATLSLGKSNSFGDALLASLPNLLWIPIPILVVWLIHKIDFIQFGRRYAVSRSLCFFSSFALLILIVGTS